MIDQVLVTRSPNPSQCIRKGQGMCDFMTLNAFKKAEKFQPAGDDRAKHHHQSGSMSQVSSVKKHLTNVCLCLVMLPREK